MEHPTLDAVKAELERAGRLDTYLGAAAVMLAERIDTSNAVMGFAALVAELRRTMDAALEGAKTTWDSWTRWGTAGPQVPDGRAELMADKIDPFSLLARDFASPTFDRIAGSADRTGASFAKLNGTSFAAVGTAVAGLGVAVSGIGTALVKLATDFD
jgi:hypothetical protein